jgi:hypothetical protein
MEKDENLFGGMWIVEEKRREMGLRDERMGKWGKEFIERQKGWKEIGRGDVPKIWHGNHAFVSMEGGRLVG